uniref:hypothetical protein n=1 Tax=Brachybacterium sp. GPGPB12 TaxID=3023517 RepID=UPI0040490E31
MTAYENLNLTDTSSSGGSRCGHTPSAEAIAQTPAEEMTECRVMAGTPVVKAQAEEAGLYRDYQGQRYWFCLRRLRPAVRRRPRPLRQRRLTGDQNDPGSVPPAFGGRRGTTESGEGAFG